MTALNKQALREAAIRAGGGKWIYIRTLSLSSAYITEETGATVINCTAGDVPAKCAGFLELANPATVLALLGEVETTAHTAAVDHEAACSLAEENEELKRRIAELESKNATVEMGRLHKRIAELEAKLETADKLQDSAFRDGLKAGFSYGQTDDQSGFTQCMSAYSNASIKAKES
ncbi:ead/Ea22-like family protein [Salmonella enterica]